MPTTDVTPVQIQGALGSSYYWGTPIITFSVAVIDSAWFYSGEPTSAGYGVLSPAQAVAFADALAAWDVLIPQDFSQVYEPDSQGHIRIAFATINAGGYAYYPPFLGGGASPRMGDIWINSGQAGFDFATTSRGLLLHEIGHALGLPHPFETSQPLPAPYDNVRYTVMSYTQTTDGSARTLSLNGSGGLVTSTQVARVTTPMVLDIAAIQAIYGADPNTAAGDTTYVFDQNSVDIRAIYDAGGIDTIDLSGFTRRSIVDLRPGAYSSIGQFTRAEQIAHYQATLNPSGGASLNASIVTALSSSNLFQWTNNLGIAFSTTIENVIGSDQGDEIIGNDEANHLRGRGGDDVLTGGLGVDTLDGGSGADTLDGGAGSDALGGGEGADTYYVDTQGDVIYEAGSDVDTVHSSASYYLWSGVENLILQGSSDLFAVGNELANALTGNSGGNLLLGGEGADVVNAGAGIDVVYGEGGNDTLGGDAGNDVLIAGDGDDALNGGAGGDSLYGEGGNDTLDGGSTFEFDYLWGGAGNDSLDGDSGHGDFDYLVGGAGDDTFLVDTPDDLTFEDAGGGTDTVIASITGAGYYLYGNTENLTLAGNTPFGVGNELNNVITGSAQGNFLLGGAGADTLNGMAGNDVLFGEAGADDFVFRAGTGGDVIGDFNTAEDRIDLAGLGFSFTQVQAAMSTDGVSTAINLGGGDFIVIHNLLPGQFSADDFVLS